MSRFGFVIPAFNTGRYLRQCVTSLFDQDCIEKPNVYVIDDGSTDETLQVLLGLREDFPSLQFVSLAENKGVSYARNLGIEKALEDGCEFVGFLDSDDWVTSNTLAVYETFLEKHPDIDAVCQRVRYFERDERYDTKDEMFFKDVVDLDYLVEKHWCVYYCNNAIIRASVLRDDPSLRFDEKAKCSEDTIFMTKLLMKLGRIGTVSESTNMHRVRADHSSTIDTLLQTKLENYYGASIDSALELEPLCLSLHGRMLPYVKQVLFHEILRAWNNLHFGKLKLANPSEFYEKVKPVLNRYNK